MPASVALAHYRRQQRITRGAVNRVQALWRQISRGNIAGSWEQIAPLLLMAVSQAQEEAAALADPYVAAVVVAQGADTDPAGRLQPGAFAGTASDGRPLLTLLYQPVIAWKQRLLAGQSMPDAERGALASALRITATQVTDAGRTAVGASMAANRTIRGYIRVATAPACARCAILSGREYGWNSGFQRHPRCDCIHVPATLVARRQGRRHSVLEHRDFAPTVGTGGPRGFLDPRTYFDSLSAAEQDRIFTKAGAQAIRDGADMAQVVNARRGMYTASAGRHRFTATREGTTRRGLFFQREWRRLQAEGVVPLGASSRGQRLRGPRLMPEEIYRLASSRDEVISLLHRFGYLI